MKACDEATPANTEATISFMVHAVNEESGRRVLGLRDVKDLVIHVRLKYVIREGIALQHGKSVPRDPAL